MPISCDRVRDLAPGFVLEALDESEMDAVRDHLATCKEPHPELAELGGVVPYIGASLIPIAPPRHLRAAVLATVQAEMAAARMIDGKAPSSARPVPVTTPAPAPVAAPVASARIVSLSEIRLRRVRRAGTWLTRAAAAVAILALAGYAWAVQPDLRAAHDTNVRTKIINNYIARPDARSVVLVPEQGQSGGGTGVLLPSGRVAVYLHGLAPTTNDEVYMVWLSSDGGGISKSGWFTVGDDGEGYLEISGTPPTDSLWLMICREPNKDVTKPGRAVATGTIWIYEPPAPTPTSV